MSRKGWIVLGWAVLAAYLVTTGDLGAKADKDPAVKELMSKMNDEKKGIRTDIIKGLDKDDPDWDALQKLTKDYLDSAKAVGKLAPPRGDKDSWAEKTKEFGGLAKDLDDAAKTKDKGKTKAVVTSKLGQTCRECHAAHRPVK